MTPRCEALIGEACALALKAPWALSDFELDLLASLAERDQLAEVSAEEEAALRDLVRTAGNALDRSGNAGPIVQLSPAP